jgi:endonuclease G
MEHDGELYIITGPIFTEESPKRLKARVAIPDFTFKIVYVPKLGGVSGYVVTNTRSPKCKVQSLAQIEAATGLDLFLD